MEKVNYSDFVRQVSKKSGYAQVNIREILDNAAQVAADNLNNNIASTIMQGVIIYPSSYPAIDMKDKDGNVVHRSEAIYPRARFGKAFKNYLLSL